MKAIYVREAIEADAEDIVQLIQELAATIGEQSPLGVRYVADYLADQHNIILLAEQNQQVGGLLAYSVRPNLYHATNGCMIEELVVRSGLRGRGIGRALMAEVLSRARLLGCAEVSVSTLPDNHQAIRFYRANGLTEEAVLLEKHFG
jgi:ribosomal protein S18 acetylase RimI-like enzyme